MAPFYDLFWFWTLKFAYMHFFDESDWCRKLMFWTAINIDTHSGPKWCKQIGEFTHVSCIRAFEYEGAATGCSFIVNASELVRHY